MSRPCILLLLLILLLNIIINKYHHQSSIVLTCPLLHDDLHLLYTVIVITMNDHHTLADKSIIVSDLQGHRQVQRDRKRHGKVEVRKVPRLWLRAMPKLR